MKMIKLTAVNPDPMSVPDTFHIPLDKVDYVIEHSEIPGSTVVVNGRNLDVIEPADYVNQQLVSLSNNNDFSDLGDFGGFDGFTN